MQLYFSTQPGCWERHLQRRYDNPLFTHGKRVVVQADIIKAQQQDEADRRAFQQTFEVLLQEITTLNAQVEVDIVLKLKMRIDGLYEQCARLGGDFTAEKQGLRQLIHLIMQSIWNSGIHNAEVRAFLEKEAKASEQHFNLLEYPLIADLLHPHSPISIEDIIPTLLTEEEVSLQAAMHLFTAQQQQILYSEAKNLLMQLKQEGYALPVAWKRLALLTSSPP
jgi:hypothetical protein